MTRRSTTQDIARYFDSHVDCCSGKPGRLEEAIWDRATRLITKAMSTRVEGLSVFEAGCGAGGLTRALIEAGASRATGIDLSELAIEVARRNAEQAGIAGRVSYLAGDGATAEVDPHDVVVLDKVVCCFPSSEALLGNVMPAAGRWLALTLPRTDGVWGALNRAGNAFMNAGYALRREGFRSYVHAEADVDLIVTGAGGALAERRVSGLWALRLYRMAG